MKIFIVLFLIISVFSLYAKDIVVTKDGNIYRGKIQKYDDKELVIEITEINIFRIPAEDILNVDFDNDMEFEEELTETKYTKGIGLSLFYPGGYNFNYDLFIKKIMVGFSFGTDFDFLYSGEFNLMYPFFIDKDFFIAPNLALGYQYYDFDNDLIIYNDYYDGGSKLYLSAAVNISIYGVYINFGVLPFRSNHIFSNYLFQDPIYLKLGYKYYY